MSDEQQLHDLLAMAAVIPDDVQPPVRQLLERGRRRRKARIKYQLATVSAIAIVAASLPVLHAVQGFRAKPLTVTGVFPIQPLPAVPGPTASELARYHWSALAPSPLQARHPAVFVLAGRVVVALGGTVGGKPSSAGATFDPVTGKWHRTAPIPADVSVASAITAWTGRQLFVTDDRIRPCWSASARPPAACEPHAGLYDPVANRWSTTPLPRSMYRLVSMTATWTGRDVILAGETSDTNSSQLEVAAYDPAANRWRMITPPLPAGHAPAYAAVAAIPGSLILWVMWQHSRSIPGGVSIASGVDVLALSTGGHWRDVTHRWAQHDGITAPFFTGTSILVQPGQIWCGDFCSPPPEILPGYFAEPVGWHRTLIPLSPLDMVDQPPYVWAGHAIIEVDANRGGTAPKGQTVRRGDTMSFDPATGRWLRQAAVPGRPFLAATPVWTGTELLALGYNGSLLALHS